MRTHSILRVVNGVLAVPLLPLVLLSTFVLGILVTVTFGLLLLPISLVWVVLFLGPLLGLSWLWLRVPFLRVPVALVGIPLAALANAYAALMPSMGENASRATKLLQVSVWPYSLQYWQWDMGRLQLDDPEAKELAVAIQREAYKNPLLTWYVQAKTAHPEAVPE